MSRDRGAFTGPTNRLLEDSLQFQHTARVRLVDGSAAAYSIRARVGRKSGREQSRRMCYVEKWWCMDPGGPIIEGPTQRITPGVADSPNKDPHVNDQGQAIADLASPMHRA